MTAPADAKAIAAGLTKAQRELLVDGGPCVRSYKPGQALVALGLRHDDGNAYTIPATLTPLGLEVRAILTKDATND